MLPKMHKNVETLERERERERERSTTKNIATKVAFVCAQKINYIENMKLVIC